MKKIVLFSFLAVVLFIISGCTLEEVHQHNGAHYSGHYNNDGHGHHGLQADDVCITDAHFGAESGVKISICNE